MVKIRVERPAVADALLTAADYEKLLGAHA
jgi:hypothetical protein